MRDVTRTLPQQTRTLTDRCRNATHACTRTQTHIRRGDIMDNELVAKYYSALEMVHRYAYDNLST